MHSSELIKGSVSAVPGEADERYAALNAYIRTQKVRRRALVAIAWLVGFYVLSLIAAAILIPIPFILVKVAGVLTCFGSWTCMVGALLIVYSLIPRPNFFKRPGPRLMPEQQPELFALIREVAQVTRQPMPAEVYLIEDVNAFVTQRGGILGLGSRPVMAVGIGLLEVLTVAELRAVLAHEFGHYYSSDVKLLDWINRAGQAMWRTIESMAVVRSAVLLPVLIPLIDYAEFFAQHIRILRRHQEFLADAVAAYICGSRSATNALRNLHGGSIAYAAYWSSNIMPRLRAGYRPHVLDGFTELIKREGIAGAMSRNVENELKHGKTEEDDTHPALPERIAALEKLAAGSGPAARPMEGEDSSVPAMSLMREHAVLDDRIVEWMCGTKSFRALVPITWEPIGRVPALDDYRSLLRLHAGAFQGLKPTDLPRLSSNIDRFSLKFVLTQKNMRSADMHYAHELASKALGAALSLALQSAGWQVSTGATGETRCERDGTIIEPFSVLNRLAWNKLTGEDWKRICREAGIADVDLGVVAANA